MASKMSKTLEEADDRLSTLPDGVISHILTFLPTRFAATTAVLSKRWRFLFHSIPHIDLDEAWQKNPEDQRQRIRTLFHEFVYRLLLSPESSHIQRLRLKCKILFKNDPINDWIGAAIRRNVEELDIFVSFRRFDTLPPETFNCKTLRSLKLYGSFIFDVPSSVHLPNLVNLHLESVRLTDGSCFRRVSSPLKHLRLCNCKIDSNQVLELVVPSLTNLILHRHYHDYKIALHTPNLECLEYSAYGAGFLIVREKLTCLIRADVDFEVGDEGEDIEPDAHIENVLVYGQYAKKIIKEIHNVKSLRLSGASLEALCYSPCSWPTFHNLTTMELGVNHIVGWQTLAKLLESSPNLQVLNFNEGFIDRSCNKLEFEYCLPGIVPTCLLQHLRKIKIGDFAGKDCEFELVEYFLTSGQVLEKIKIRSQTFWGWPSSFCERLLGYPRCSKTCNIILSWKIDENFRKRILN